MVDLLTTALPLNTGEFDVCPQNQCNREVLSTCSAVKYKQSEEKKKPSTGKGVGIPAPRWSWGKCSSPSSRQSRLQLHRLWGFLNIRVLHVHPE